MKKNALLQCAICFFWAQSIWASAMSPKAPQNITIRHFSNGCPFFDSHNLREVSPIMKLKVGETIHINNIHMVLSSLDSSEKNKQEKDLIIDQVQNLSQLNLVDMDNVDKIVCNYTVKAKSGEVINFSLKDAEFSKEAYQSQLEAFNAEFVQVLKDGLKEYPLVKGAYMDQNIDEAYRAVR
jgi:hypothetical protein